MEKGVLSSKKADIFDFSDYRAFLQTHFFDTKKTQKGWTYGAWAKKLGLKNNTSILKILNGSRDAGPEITEKLIHYFGFRERERQYFEDLILLSKSQKNPARKVAIMSRLQQRHPKNQFTLLDDKTFSAISHWWFYAIRQLTHLKSFRLDPEWIAAQFRFKLSTKEVSNAIKTMSELNLLAIDTVASTASVQNTSLNTSDDVAHEALKRYHEEVLTLAKLAIRSVPVQERQISGTTFSVKAQDFQRMREFIQKFEDQFCDEFEQPTDGDTIYQFHTLLFPLTKKNPNPGEPS